MGISLLSKSIILMETSITIYCLIYRCYVQIVIQQLTHMGSQASSTLKMKDDLMQFNTQADLDNYNNNLVETNVRLMGDKTVVGQVVQLLSYIRHAIRNNLKTTIEVDIANTVANVPFMLDANGMEVPDLVTVKKVQVN